MAASPRPYRSTAPGAPRVEAPREFVYVQRRGADEHAFGRGLFPLLLVGGLACAVLGMYDEPGAGVALFAAVAAWGWWRRARRMSGVVVRVENRTMLVYRWRGARTASVVALTDVHDVCLDTKMIHRAQRETRPGVFAPGGFSGSLAVDVARITLVLAPGVPPIELSADYASHSETVEQIGKLKTLLRSWGWLPLDEREPE